MLVVWLLLTLNLVLVRSSEVQQSLPICDKDAASGANCTTAETTTTTIPSTTSATSNATTVQVSVTTDSSNSSSNSSVTTESSLVTDSSITAVPSDGSGQATMKPQADEETNRNASSGSAQGRAMSFDVQEHTQTPVPPEKGSLQDLSLDDIDESAILPTPVHDKANATPFNTTTPTPLVLSSTSTERPASTTIASNSSELATINGTNCVQGQKFDRGCSETCECGHDGKVACRPRCSMPFFRRGASVNDPACIEKFVEDPCCSLMICTQDTETEPLEGCTFKNQSYQRGDTIKDGCLAVCTCAEAGQVLCKPRCPPVNKNSSSSDRCVELPDPNDSCCTVVLCDVTLTDHDVSKTGVEEATPTPHLQLLTVDVVNKSAVRLGLAGEPQPHHENITVETSLDQKTWKRQESQGLVVMGLEPGHTYYIRAKSGSMVSNAVEVSLPAIDSQQPSAAGCQYKGRHYMLREEFYEGCEAFCECTESGVQCATIDCPTEFGLDVLNPHCIDWETHPPDFNPSPPNCCPSQVRCKNNGSCTYEGQHFNNWAEIPMKLTGCSKRCYCEFGNVTCQSTCPPVTANPPSDLQCPPQQAILSHLPGDECCLYWLCPQVQSSGFNQPPLPPGFPLQRPINRQDEITVHTLEAVDENTVKLVFSVPPVLVGLHGRVELRYTSDTHNNDPASWEQQVLAPPGDLIATQQLEFELGDLLPDTQYKIKITVILRDLHNSPSSRVLTVHTPPSATPATTLPPQIPVDVGLTVVEVNATWARLIWRKFTEFELQFIDGVQLRYKEKEGKVYAATPLIHRAVTSYTLEDMRPHTEYEVGIFFIPFPGQTTELMDEHNAMILTADVHDLYKFNVTLDVQNIKPTSVELSWNGVPYPEDKYVNIFRAIYQSDAGKEDFSTFKVAKRDSQARTIIQDLKPGTRYRLWLEVYLTNGKIKKSNVQDFMTKPGAVPSVGATQQGKLKGGGPEPLVEATDYYGPFVAVAIIAALAVVVALILLLILMRKHGHNKAAISATRKSQSAYDNPSYKVEIQQETMDL
ncbi:putative epidermal cell surface receptor isoform X2 [Periplaneta americana]|uniref:putative epidermal cell surface receptor isoform X2 n=1 Tax=Periplaneta americana TaxID=6978 RepID=UPI0037E7F1FD